MDEEELRSCFANEWRRAQAITLTIPNLVTAAKQQLRFLARVNQQPELTQPGPALNRAIRRYRLISILIPNNSYSELHCTDVGLCGVQTDRYEVCWLPLLASQVKGGSALVPPLDCAWIWHCHRLNPVSKLKLYHSS